MRGRRGAALLPLLLLLGCTGAAASPLPTRVEIVLRYSQFEPDRVRVLAGVPVTIVLRNDDPIDHEWIVGSDEVHTAHRAGSEPHHEGRPTEVSIDALSVRETTITFDTPGTLSYICHLPGHEAYGMVGTLEVAAAGT